MDGGDNLLFFVRGEMGNHPQYMLKFQLCACLLSQDQVTDVRGVECTPKYPNPHLSLIAPLQLIIFTDAYFVPFLHTSFLQRLIDSQGFQYPLEAPD